MADKLQHYVAQFDKELDKFPILKEIEKQTKVPKAFFCGGVAAFLVLLVFLNIGGRLITNLLGFVYPAYASFKAIESTNKEDDVQWLTYWTVFGFLNLIEFFTDIILYWVPYVILFLTCGSLYFTFKSIFVLYLALPQFKGAAKIYTQFLRPVLIKDASRIDAELDKIKNKVNSVVSELKKD